MTPHASLRPLLCLAALVLATTAAHASWPAQGLPVCLADNAQSGVRATGDGAEGAVVAWVDMRDGDPDVYARRVLAGGALGWGQDVALCDTVGAQVSIAIAGDGSGGAFVAWEDERKGAGDPDIFVQRVSSAGVALWTRNGVRACGAAGVQGEPCLVADGAGGVYVAWVDRRGVYSDLYAQRLNGSGVAQWTADGVVLCSAANDQTALSCAPDGAGGLLAAWEDTRVSPMVSDIYAQRVASDGNRLWTLNGVVVSISIGLRQAYAPQVVGDGAGGALIAWEDYRTVSGGIYGTRLDAAGALVPGWLGDLNLPGKTVCDTTDDQTTPVVVSDGAGGMIVAWQDNRAGSATDLHAQRMGATGTPLWPTPGVPVCEAANDQTSLCAAPDGAGGALFAWYDFRDGSTTDIYAQRITAAGGVAAGWSANGVAVCTAAADQQSPALVARADGGALVAWQDYRDLNDYDIYAQAVSGEGGAAGVLPALPGVSFRAGEPRPNPSPGASRIELELPAARTVSARVLDPSGRRVRTLEAGRRLEAGRHGIAWDGRDEAGAPVAPGVYLVRIDADRESQVRRVVRLR